MHGKKILLSGFLMMTVLTAAIAQTPAVQPLKTSAPEPPKDGSVALGSSKFYVKLYGGYGFLTPGSYKLNSIVTNSSNTPSSFSVGAKGMGEGLHYGGGAGYIINDFLNVGIDADYLSGNDLTSQSIPVSNPEYYSSSSEKVTYSILSIIPNITFKALSKPTYFIYTRIGIILTAHTRLISSKLDSSDDKGSSSPYDQDVTNTTTTYKSNLNVGVQVAPGVQFQISGHIRGFAELVGTYLPVNPSSSVQIIRETFYDDGHNVSPVNANSGHPYNPTTSTATISYSNSGGGANQSPKSVFNANSIGINAGVAYRF